jgi:predicted DNA-binding protein
MSLDESVTIATRLSLEDHQALQELASLEGLTKGEIIRRAVRAEIERATTT